MSCVGFVVLTFILSMLASIFSCSTSFLACAMLAVLLLAIEVLGEFSRHKFWRSGVWTRSHGPNCWCRRGCVPSGCSQGELVFLLFLASRGCQHSLALGPFPHLQQQQRWVASFSHHISLTSSVVISPLDSPLCPFSTSKNPYNCIGSNQIIQNNLFIFRSAD